MSVEQPRRDLAEEDPLAEGVPEEPEPPESEREAEKEVLEDEDGGQAA